LYTEEWALKNYILWVRSLSGKIQGHWGDKKFNFETGKRYTKFGKILKKRNNFYSMINMKAPKKIFIK
jgi:hypothetical protein